MTTQSLAQVSQQIQSLTNRIAKLGGNAGISNMNITGNARRLRYTNEAYSWREDGNLVGTSMSDMPMLQSRDYNMVYAIAARPHWPVPRPVTNPETHGFSYVSNCGTFNMATTITSGDTNPTYVVIATCPESNQVVNMFAGEAITFVYPPTNTGDKPAGYPGPTVRSNWTQTDPRIMIAGSDKTGTGIQQHMGGEVNFSFSVPWDGNATVGIINPFEAPSIIGNKKLSAVGTTVSSLRPNDDFSYYQISGLSGGSITHGALYGNVTESYVLNGGGQASRVDIGYRLVPNTQQWVYLDGNDGLNEQVFSASPIIMVMLPPKQSFSVNCSGWVSYNVSINTDTPVGALLAQDAPIATPHSTEVRNVPMIPIVGKTPCEQPYLGFSLPKMSAGLANPSSSIMQHNSPQNKMSLVRNMLGDIKNVAHKFLTSKPISDVVGSAINRFGRWAMGSIPKVGKLAVKAAPLMPM